MVKRCLSVLFVVVEVRGHQTGLEVFVNDEPSAIFLVLLCRVVRCLANDFAPAVPHLLSKSRFRDHVLALSILESPSKERRNG